MSTDLEEGERDRKFQQEMEKIEKDVKETHERIEAQRIENEKKLQAAMSLIREQKKEKSLSLAAELEAAKMLELINRGKQESKFNVRQLKIGDEAPRPGIFRRIFNRAWDFVFPQDRKVSELISKLERQAVKAINQEKYKPEEDIVWHFEAEDLITLIELEESKESAWQATKDKINGLIRGIEEHETLRTEYDLMKEFCELEDEGRKIFLDTHVKEMSIILNINNRIDNEEGIPYSSTLGKILRRLNSMSSNSAEAKEEKEEQLDYVIGSERLTSSYDRRSDTSSQSKEINPNKQKKAKKKRGWFKWE